MADAPSEAEARAAVDSARKKLLANLIMEGYRFRPDFTFNNWPTPPSSPTWPG